MKYVHTKYTKYAKYAVPALIFVFMLAAGAASAHAKIEGGSYADGFEPPVLQKIGAGN